MVPSTDIVTEGAMQDDTPMTIAERRTYLGRMRGRYLRAARVERGRLLNVMELVTGLHRKSLLRLLHTSDLARQPRTRQRAKTYGAAVDDAIRLIWESLDYICAERLTPALVLTAKQLVAHGELVVTDALLAQLHTSSVASVQRRLTRFVQDTPRLPRRGPDTPIAWRVAFPCGPSPGMNPCRAILRSTWCIMAVPSRAATTSTRSK
jgi:hypothetical protein